MPVDPISGGGATEIIRLLDLHPHPEGGVWHFYAGAPLEIRISQNGSETSVHRLGPDLFAGERPQFVVPAHCWQKAISLGAWTLVGCGVAPGFEFSGFELAPPGWPPCACEESPSGK